TLAQMQNLIYDQAPYDILYYDSNLDVYRTDKFGGWQNMPSDGTPMFTYGDLQYTLLNDAKAQPSAAPSAPSAPSAGTSSAVPGASAAAPTAAAPGSPASSSSSNTPLLIGLAVVAVIVVVGGFLWSRSRRSSATDDE